MTSRHLEKKIPADVAFFIGTMFGVVLCLIAQIVSLLT